MHPDGRREMPVRKPLPYARAPRHSQGVKDEGEDLVESRTRVDSFTGFVQASEPRIRQALTVAFGSDVGREATAEALAYGWEHWDRVSEMDNPAGYLYVVGRDRARRARGRRRPRLIPVDTQRLPWIEPDLPQALARLSEQQRTVIMLLHCFQWSMSEVAELLDVSKSTVQSHSERGMARLRRKLGVAS